MFSRLFLKQVWVPERGREGGGRIEEGGREVAVVPAASFILKKQQVISIIKASFFLKHTQPAT